MRYCPHGIDVNEYCADCVRIMPYLTGVIKEGAKVKPEEMVRKLHKGLRETVGEDNMKFWQDAEEAFQKEQIEREQRRIKEQAERLKNNTRNSCDVCMEKTTHYYKLKKFRHDGLYNKIKEDGWKLCIKCLAVQVNDEKNKGDNQ